MHIEVFDPTMALSDGIVVFPARIAVPGKDSTTRFKYQKAIRRSDLESSVVSCVFDRFSNRVKLTMDCTPKVFSRRDRDSSVLVMDGPEREATMRTTMEIKLDIPRGSLSAQKVTTLSIIEAPDYWCSNDKGKLKTADGTIIPVTQQKQCRDIYNKLFQWLRDQFKENGCPEAVDRRRLPELLKSYTGELRAQWRLVDRNFDYPANGLATALVDMLTGRRSPETTLDQLIEWHLIADYPTITQVSGRGKNWDSMRQTAFVGIYMAGGSNKQTKNTQLLWKLNNMLGEQFTLQGLDAAFTEFYRRHQNEPGATQPQILLNSDGNRLYFVGVTKTTRREENRQ